MKDQELKEKFIELRARGKSYAVIASMLGICKKTAVNWAKELKNHMHTIKAFEPDALYEEHALSPQERIELLGDQLAKIRQRLTESNAADSSMSSFLPIVLKISNTLQRACDALQSHGIPDDPIAT